MKEKKDRADAERRRSALRVEIVVALTARGAAVERHEAIAAEAITKLLVYGGVSPEDVSTWADALSLSEVQRLKRIVARPE